MGCEHIKIGDAEAIICSRRRRPAPCSVGLCGRPSVALCDYKVERNGKPATCDSPMCARHRHPVDKNVDWCEGHYNYERKMAERVADANREMGLPEDGEYGDK